MSSKNIRFNNILVKFLHELKDHYPEEYPKLQEWYYSFKKLETQELKTKWISDYIVNNLKPFESSILAKDSSIFAKDDPMYKNMKIELFGGIDSRKFFNTDSDTQRIIWEYIQMVYVFGLAAAKTEQDFVENLILTIQAQKNARSENESEFTNPFATLKSMAVFTEIYNLFKYQCKEIIDFDKVNDFTGFLAIVTNQQEQISQCIMILFKTVIAVCDKHRNEPTFIKGIVEDISSCVTLASDKIDSLLEDVPKPVITQILNYVKNSGITKSLPEEFRDIKLTELLPRLKGYLQEFTTTQEQVETLFNKYYDLFVNYINDLEETGNNSGITEYINSLVSQMTTLLKKFGIESEKDIIAIKDHPEEFITKIMDSLKQVQTIRA